MTDPKIVAVIARSFVSYTEIASVRALVREVNVEVSVQCIKVGILAVFVLVIVPFIRIRLIPAPLVFVFARAPRSTDLA